MRRWTRAVPALLVLLTVTAASAPAGAAPGWTSRTSVASGSVGMARWDADFEVVQGSGEGGDSFVHRNLLLGDVTLVDLKNTGTVALRLTGTMTLTTVLGGSISISECRGAAGGVTCPSEVRVLTSLAVLGTVVLPMTYGDGSVIAPGHAVHLRVETRGAVGNTVRMTAVPVVRSPGDRTRP